MGLGLSSASAKVGFVDMTAAVQSTKAGKKAKSTLEKEFKKKKVILDKKQAALEKMQKSFIDKNVGWSEKVRSEKQKELSGAFSSYQQSLQRSQEEIRKREQALTAPIYAKMKRAIASLAKKKGYRGIFDKNNSGVLWMMVDNDLTDDLIKEYKSTK